MAGEIDLGTDRVLTRALGQDASGLWGMQAVSSYIPHPGYAAGDYVVPLNLVAAQDRTPSTSAQVTAWPFFFPAATPLDRIGVYLTTAQAGAAAMFGLYSNVGGRPGSLLLDCGELSLAAGSGANALKTISYTTPVGLIWALCWVKDVATQVTVKGVLYTAGGIVGLPSDTISGTMRGNLLLTSAYPASMPSTAPAVVPATTASTPAIIMRAA